MSSDYFVRNDDLGNGNTLALALTLEARGYQPHNTKINKEEKAWLLNRLLKRQQPRLKAQPKPKVLLSPRPRKSNANPRNPPSLARLWRAEDGGGRAGVGVYAHLTPPRQTTTCPSAYGGPPARSAFSCPPQAVYLGGCRQGRRTRRENLRRRFKQKWKRVSYKLFNTINCSIWKRLRA